MYGSFVLILDFNLNSALFGLGRIVTIRSLCDKICLDSVKTTAARQKTIWITIEQSTEEFFDSKHFQQKAAKLSPHYICLLTLATWY